VDDTRITLLGPGEIIGDMSFLEKRPASASVFAVENSLLMVLSQEKIEGKLNDDPGFAVRFYKSLAILNSKRLRITACNLGLKLREKGNFEPTVISNWKSIADAIHQFKTLIHLADKEAIKNHGIVPPETQKQIVSSFREFCVFMNEQIGDDSNEPDYIKEEIGNRIKLEILPFLLQTQTAERMYSKPRGYAGDYLTIHKIYENKPTGTGRLGPVLDKCFLNEPAARAVQNRRGLLVQEIMKVVESKSPDTQTKILTVACGPAAEVFDVFERLDNPDRLHATLVDIDLQALAFVDDKIERMSLKRHMKPLSGNLVYLSLGREKLDIKAQDLIYSIGLIDYFNDKFVNNLLNYLYGLLKPGGKVILGNFHPKNTSKAMMDHVIEWELIHRTEEDMNRLFSNSQFKSPCTDIKFESAGVNLFAECIKREN